MTLSVSDIVREVRVILDQNQVESNHGVLQDDPDTLELDDIIRQKILHAAELLYSMAPLSAFDSFTSFPTSSISGMESEEMPNGLYCHYLPLPDNYLRLAVVKMSSWDIPVRIAVGDDTETAMAQRSRFKGITGNVRRPIVIESEDADGRCLRLYATNSRDDELEMAKYIAMPTFVGMGDNQSIEVASKMRMALLYEIAGLTEISRQEIQFGNALLQLAQQYIGAESEGGANG